MMRRSRWNRTRWGKLLPALFLCYAVGCLPEDAFTQVLGENLLLTSATVIQSVTALIFNTVFGLS